MISYGYYVLIAVYCIYLAVTLVIYFAKPAPGGDASVGWAMGIVYAAICSGTVVIALLFWQRQSAGLAILCIPIVLLAMPMIRNKLTDLYAGMPSFSNIAPLLLSIKNSTASTVHVQVNCWFSTGDAHIAALYKTLNYTIEPNSIRQYPLTSYQTNLLAVKSKYVSIVMYECIRVEHGSVTYTREIQPCMQFYEEQAAAFRSGKYDIVVDSSKNSDAFKKEIELLKKQHDYPSGSY
jgi:hypothetical protein